MRLDDGVAAGVFHSVEGGEGEGGDPEVGGGHGKVGPGRYCSPRHATHLEPSSLELKGTL